MPSKPSILIAEDDRILREAYSKRFSRRHCTLRIAADGKQAIQMIQEEQPDLLICDILMPNADGWDVLDSLPSKTKRPFPVIMLTNMEDDTTKKRMKEHKISHYLVKKDMTLRSLNELVDSLLPSS